MQRDDSAAKRSHADKLDMYLCGVLRVVLAKVAQSQAGPWEAAFFSLEGHHEALWLELSKGNSTQLHIL